MTLLRISEVFGHSVSDLGPDATRDREHKRCPFRNGPCTKVSRERPLGVCTLSDTVLATSICPVRFQEGDRIFIDAARIAFGEGVRFVPVPEVSILRVAGSNRKIGKVDFILAQLDASEGVSDFAALEVQAVYFSGVSIRPEMDYFLANDELDPRDRGRRPDYRSSAQKRLMPQLSLKVPVFRRWGKKFIVAVDSLFFAALPEFRTIGAANTEITWLSYPIANTGAGYGMQEPTIVYSLWEDILTALREGEAPEPSEIIDELASKMDLKRILST